MVPINPNEAPEGYVARKPKGYINDITPLCTGCALWKEVCSTEPSCGSEFRVDKHDVIFVKKT